MRPGLRGDLTLPAWLTGKAIDNPETWNYESYIIRRNNWMEGLLVTGGYREAGAWLNTAYWLNLTAMFDSSLASPSLAWERVTNISPMFDGGRHNHALTTTAMLYVKKYLQVSPQNFFQTCDHRWVEEQSSGQYVAAG